MKFAYIPSSITLTDPVTKKEGETVSFATYAFNYWLNDPKWEKPRTNLARLVKVQAEITKPAGSLMKFEDDDWKVLKSILDDESAPIPTPQVQLQLEFFCETIRGAKDKDPEELIRPAIEAAAS